MRVFVTGATGFIGSAIVPELINAGYQVLGLTRSEVGAQSLIAVGAEVHRGNLEDLESLSSGAAASDGVIHCAFDHDFSNFVANCEKDRRAIEAIGSVLVGSDRPLLITSGTGMGSGAPGQPATEDNFDLSHPNPRKASEEAGVSVADSGVNVSVVRLPQVHDPVKQGLITPLIQVAREKGVSAYVGGGLNRWPAAHVSAVAHLYRLALEKGEAGSRYHAVAEEGVSARDIAEVLGRGLNVPVVSLSPEEAAAHFGWLGMFVGLDMPASSAQTQERLGWHPTGPGLIADLEQIALARRLRVIKDNMIEEGDSAMPQDSSANAAKKMKAMMLPQFGGVDQFRLEDIERPSPGRGEVLIQIAGTSVNPVDAKARAGELLPMFPAERLPLLLGFDASGRIEEVGTGVTDWKIGDAVYGFPGADPGTAMKFCRGTFAEYVCLRTDEVAAAPQSIPLADAGALPLAAMTAWHGLMTQGEMQRSQHVLIQGDREGSATSPSSSHIGSARPCMRRHPAGTQSSSGSWVRT